MAEPHVSSERRILNRPLTKLERFIAEAQRRWPGAKVVVRKKPNIDVEAVVNRLLKLPGLRLIRTGPDDPGALDAPWLNWEIQKAVAALPAAPAPVGDEKTTGHLSERHAAIQQIHLRLWEGAAAGEVPVLTLPTKQNGGEDEREGEQGDDADTA